LLALSMAAIMVAGSLTACGEQPAQPADPAAQEPAAAEPATGSDDAAQNELDTTVQAAEVGEDTGKVLNIYCWNEEFKSRLTDHYPGYTEVDATHGTIGDVQVVWNITPSENNAYQNNLDETLLKQADAAADDKIDMFLVEADYALKYVDTDYTMAVTDLGIDLSELSDQYDYTQKIMTDSNGLLKGVSWQGCPAGLIYNREIAKQVFGTDDPAEVQTHLSDWAAYNAAAAEIKAAGYYMTATVNDSFRVYSNNVSTKWVEGGKINIDANIKAWVDDTKAQLDAGQIASTAALWSDDWSKGFYPDGKVFCYFGPAWLIDFCMAGRNDDGSLNTASVAGNGGWAVCEGPQGFFWGGTWIAAATGTDNAQLVADIMRKLTVDDAIMTDIAKNDSDFVNNKSVIETLKTDDSFGDELLGGQNAIAVLAAGADSINLSKLTSYDQGCNEEFQAAMKNYFDGNATYEEALEQFYTAIGEKYPELDTSH